MAFDIASVLKTAAENSDQEQIVYLPVDSLVPDDCNFYSLEGIDELASSIELLGLQQPLRVRPGEGGTFIIVSGHRRRAAILLIRDGGSKQFEKGVPCIVEYGEASAAMRELRLIFANAQTRVMSPSDTMKQAERVETLLYELKEQGVEFPGRMRDHVAQACQVSKTKIARLHAIRTNLDVRLLAYFNRGEMSEETAYQLQRLPAEIQLAAADQLSVGKRKKLPTAETVAAVNKNLEGYQKELSCRCHAGGPDCHWKNEKILRSVFAPYSWQVCDAGRCCRDCYHAGSCSGCCPEQKARQKLDKDCAKEKQAEQKKAEEERQHAYKRSLRITAKRLLPVIDASGLPDDHTFPGKHEWHKIPISTIRSWAADDFGDAHFYDSQLLPTRTDLLQQWADDLHCTTDRLLGRAEDPQPVSDSDTAPGWQTGTPEKTGMYVIIFGITEQENQSTRSIMIAAWDNERFASPRTNVPITGTVYRWVKLPEV